MFKYDGLSERDIEQDITTDRGATQLRNAGSSAVEKYLSDMQKSNRVGSPFSRHDYRPRPKLICSQEYWSTHPLFINREYGRYDEDTNFEQT